MTMRFFAAIGVLAICLCAAAAVYLYGGFYSVAASEPHSGFIAWSLEHIRDASVARHVDAGLTGSLDDPALIKKGAHEFVEEGCVDCHGGPGVEPEKFATGMRPEPPELAEHAHHLDAAETVWIIRHGIKMTGMPAFGGHTDADEQRALVAFVLHIKSVPPAEFRTIKQQTAQKGGEEPKDAGQ